MRLWSVMRRPGGREVRRAKKSGGKTQRAASKPTHPTAASRNSDTRPTSVALLHDDQLSESEPSQDQSDVDQNLDEVMPITAADETSNTDSESCDSHEEDGQGHSEDDNESQQSSESDKGSAEMDDGNESDETSDDDEKNDVGGLASWGRKKDVFYGGDDAAALAEQMGEDVDSDEEANAERLEYEEVVALQKKQAAQIDVTDIGDLSEAAKNAAKVKRSSFKSHAHPLNGVDVPVRIESIDRELEEMSDVERKKLLEAEAPELEGLLEDFKLQLDEVRERLGPLLSKLSSPADGGHSLDSKKPSDAVALLQLKFQLLLSYCTNIAFYLLLKAQGQRVRDHPVITSLLRHRTLIERIQPLEKKMKYRVQKLLALQAGIGSLDKGSDSGGRDESMMLKPNPDALLTEELEYAESTPGVYRPPQVAAVPYTDDNDGEAKRTRQRERALARAASTRLARELREDLSDAPTRIHADDFGAKAADSEAYSRLRHEEEARRAFEEENFTRLTLNKQQKRELRKRRAAADRADDLDQFDDFSHLYGVTTGTSSRETSAAEDKMRALRQYMNSIEMRSRKGRVAGDETTESRRSADESVSSRVERRAPENTNSNFEENFEGHEAESVAEDPAFIAAEVSSKLKRQRRAERSAAADMANAESLAARRHKISKADKIAGDEKRKASREIMKNRGLTRDRKKLDRNPRSKNREKFRRAVIKRKGQVRDVRSSGDAYSGEATGINAKVVHSHRYK